MTQPEGLHSPGLGVLIEYCMASKQCFQMEASYNTEICASLIGLSCFVRCFAQMNIHVVMHTYIGLAVPCHQRDTSSGFVLRSILLLSMDKITSRDDANTKPDVLSRETTLGDGQVEKIHSTDEPIPGPPPNNEANSDHSSGSNHNEPPRGRAGYTHLAQTMTQTQLGMVRKYKELSLLNLLYLQAEIHQLQTDWEYQVAADARPDADPRRRQWDYHWWAMVDGEAQGLGGQRWEAWLKLRERLYEYCAQDIHSVPSSSVPSLDLSLFKAG